MATWQVDCEGTELTATAESGKQNLCGRGCVNMQVTGPALHAQAKL